ncbi:probable fatty acyl-CoA reductase 4 [Humulus lupulus]|uniref:probable fatty acyl-CoA reductase 4 n=1 Tax=Humulus lupulus TaxID=3486 RepID=UPI002B416AAC|nr:probable fatty acyl-CoA reductase 4 [Humulus lupulus]
MENIQHFLESKTILVTGSTGFLGKLLVEKILRIQPNVKKFYLLLRAPDGDSAMQRMQSEVVGKELFKDVRKKWGKDFDSFISEKLIPVPGDVSSQNLGVEEVNLREEMWKDIDIIVNSAATTDFYERYDTALNINSMGVLNVVKFAMKCVKLKMLLHVSTAYVCGEGEGVIVERELYPGQTLRATSSKLDFEIEMKLAAQKLDDLRAQGISEALIASDMKDFGIQRAKKFGWPNTYVFTKAMGEMCIGQYKDSLPTVIIRPTMITSTYNEPFPGWIEGLRTIDSVVVGHGKGKITCFLADPACIMDMIPGDMLINAMIVAMVAHANQCFSKSTKNNNIYHVGSSLRNPISFSMLHQFSYSYFTKNPLISMDGKPIKITKGTVLSNMPTFRIYMLIRYLLPLQMLQLLSKAFPSSFRDLYVNSMRKFNLVTRLVQLYKPYVLFKGIFDDTNSERLREKAREIFNYVEVDLFNFDPKCIDWKDYLINIHFPGVKKFVIKK